MQSTKDKILDAAINLFNQYGIINVRLQQIADTAQISVGNLAYHYYSKKAIVEAIDRQLGNEISPLLALESDFFNLLDFDNHLSNFYYLINSYSFYFLDVLELERAYPLLHGNRKEYIERILVQIESWLTQNSKKGAIGPELFPEQFQNSAVGLWMIMTFWLTQTRVRQNVSNNETAFKKAIWMQLVPLFTESGVMEFEAFILPQLDYHSQP